MLTFYDPNIVTTIDDFQNNTTENLSFSVNPTFVKRISPLWNMNTGVNFGANDRKLDRKQGNSALPDAIIDSLSADFKTNELYANPFINLQRMTEKTYMNFSFAARWTQFDKVFYDNSLSKSNYFYFTPGFGYNNNYREGRRVEIRYSSSVGLPGLNQLLPVNNTANPFSQYQGNINLKPEQRHNGNIT
jgi:hypothetical protein